MICERAGVDGFRLEGPFIQLVVDIMLSEVATFSGSDLP
jgi:hypothetical protein